MLRNIVAGLFIAIVLTHAMNVSAQGRVEDVSDIEDWLGDEGLLAAGDENPQENSLLEIELRVRRISKRPGSDIDLDYCLGTYVDATPTLKLSRQMSDEERRGATGKLVISINSFGGDDRGGNPFRYASMMLYETLDARGSVNKRNRIKEKLSELKRKHDSEREDLIPVRGVGFASFASPHNEAICDDMKVMIGAAIQDIYRSRGERIELMP